MLGATHALCGLVLGCGVAVGAGHFGAPPAVQIGVVAVTGGSALLPDIDAKGSTVSRSLWLVTKLMSYLAVTVSRFIYHMSRGPRDTQHGGGHRYFWHTVPGCVTFGAIAAGVTVTHDLVAAVTVGLLIALLGNAYRPVAGLLGVTIIAVTVLAVESPSHWWWAWGLAVFAGSWAHRAGDRCTKHGVPRWDAMVRERDGKRWSMVTAEFPMSTGNRVEKLLNTFVLTPALLVGLLFVTGVAPVLIVGLSGG